MSEIDELHITLADERVGCGELRAALEAVRPLLEAAAELHRAATCETDENPARSQAHRRGALVRAAMDGGYLVALEILRGENRENREPSNK